MNSGAPDRVGSFWFTIGTCRVYFCYKSSDMSKLKVEFKLDFFNCKDNTRPNINQFIMLLTIIPREYHPSIKTHCNKDIVQYIKTILYGEIWSETYSPYMCLWRRNSQIKQFKSDTSKLPWKILFAKAFISQQRSLFEAGFRKE